MKKIKEFAVLCGTSSKTLRFYDRIGLLEAEYTDPENGYRYYSDGQKNQYEVISMFKEIGFTLDEIKTGILGVEDEAVLEILKKKAAELDRARTLCRAQIGEYEKRVRRKSAPGNGEVAVQRIPEEGKIILTDGVETRVFLCQGEALDACADAMEEMFSARKYLNLSFTDLEETEADRSVMTQVTEGTLDELLNADWEPMFGEGAENVRTLAVLIRIPRGLQMNLTDVRGYTDTILARLQAVFPESCRVLWGGILDETRRDSAKICVMGIA